MKILYYSFPGYADCDFPLVKALMELGHDVYYVMTVSPYNLHQTVIDIDKQSPRNEIISAHEYPCFSRFDGYLDLDKVFVQNDTAGHYSFKFYLLHRKFVRFVKNLNPDVVLCSGLLRLFPSISFCGKTKVACVVHDPLPHSGDDGLRNRFAYHRLRWYADRVILLNNNQTLQFCKRLKFPPEKVAIASLMPYETIKLYGSNTCTSGGYILFFGRISKYKGISCLLEAMDSVHNKMPAARLMIAGAGTLPEAPGIQRDYVTVINRYLTYDEIADYVRASAFVVCPYTDATQSGVVQTVFALGKPVLATSVGNFPQIIHDGFNGRLVPPRDSRALAEAIYDMLSCPDILEKMSENVSSAANCRLETAARYESVLKDLCDENS